MVAGHTRGNLGGPNAGAGDAFLTRYDGAGNQLWIRQFGTSEDEDAVALAPDDAGGVMIAGSTGGSLGGPNPGSRYDAFVGRFDGAGNQLWIRQFGTSTNDQAFALAPDGAGGVTVAGSTAGSLGGPSAGSDDAFLARYDGAGDQLWIRQFGTSAHDQALALAPDGEGGVTVAGATGGSLGGPSAGNTDAFLDRYDSEGNRIWVWQLGTNGNDEAFALTPNDAGGVMVAGWTDASLGGPNAGGRDAFLARFIDAFPLGDLNCDGLVDSSDIEAFIVALFDSLNYPVLYPDCDINLADINGDGLVNAEDIEGFIQLLFGP